MTGDELKRRVDEAIERHADEIIEVGETIRRHPELGFKESRTAALVESKFRKLGLMPRAGLALTGVRADMAGGQGPGPTVGLLAEYDARLMSCHRLLVSRLLVHRLHAAGDEIWVWTVDRLSEIDHLREIEVDGICSDDPASHGWEEQVAEKVAQEEEQVALEEQRTAPEER